MRGLLLIAACLWLGCSSEKEQGNDGSATGLVKDTVKVLKPEEQYKQTISEIEKKMHETGADFNRPLASTAVKAYLEFCNSFPQDEQAPDYLFKAAEIENNLGETDSSLKHLDQVVQKYPAYKNVSFALYLQGVIYEDKRKDLKKAEAKYKEVIQKYPGTPAAQSAEGSLSLLGKSDEEIIRSFKKG
jgi:outer membrane protein assembly factor BamD (BamD/ComL family)